MKGLILQKMQVCALAAQHLSCFCCKGHLQMWRLRAPVSQPLWLPREGKTAAAGTCCLTAAGGEMALSIVAKGNGGSAKDTEKSVYVGPNVVAFPQSHNCWDLCWMTENTRASNRNCTNAISKCTNGRWWMGQFVYARQGICIYMNCVKKSGSGHKFKTKRETDRQTQRDILK